MEEDVWVLKQGKEEFLISVVDQNSEESTVVQNVERLKGKLPKKQEKE